MVDGVADFFQQHGLDLLRCGQLQPGGIDVDAFATIGCSAGVRSDEAIDGGVIQDLKVDVQSRATDGGEQSSTLGTCAGRSPKHLLEQGMESDWIPAPGRQAPFQQQQCLVESSAVGCGC